MAWEYTKAYFSALALVYIVLSLGGMAGEAAKEIGAASEAWKAAGEPTDLAGLVDFLGRASIN